MRMGKKEKCTVFALAIFLILFVLWQSEGDEETSEQGSCCSYRCQYCDGLWQNGFVFHCIQGFAGGDTRGAGIEVRGEGERFGIYVLSASYP